MKHIMIIIGLGLAQKVGQKFPLETARNEFLGRLATFWAE